MPGGCGPPLIETGRPDELLRFWLVLSSPSLSPIQLSDLARGEVRGRLAAVPGVGRVRLFGAVNRTSMVHLDPQKLAALGVAPADVSRAIESWPKPAAPRDGPPREPGKASRTDKLSKFGESVQLN